jgi:hypothetical protein
MSLPQLTAELSLYRSDGHYRVNARAGFLGSSARALGMISPGDTGATGSTGETSGGGATAGATPPITCAPGWELIGTQCVPPLPCPPGYTGYDGICQPNEIINVHGCPPGFIDTGNQCLPIEITIPAPIWPGTPNRCPPGYILRNGQCRNIGTITRGCAPGFELQGTKCVPIPITCPTGYELQGNKCVPVVIFGHVPVKGAQPVFNSD